MITKNPALLDAAANRLFVAGMHESAPMSYVPDLATSVTSNKRTETFPHIGDGPAMDEIRPGNPYTFTPMSEASISSTTRKFGAGLAISQDDWDDDQLAGYAERISEMGDESVLLPNALLISALINGDGAGNNSYDGVTFFNAAHPARGQQTAPQSNILTGGATSVAGILTSLNLGVARFGTFRRENGRAANPSIRRVTIAAPYALREPIILALQAAVVNNTSNVTLRGIQWTVIFDADLDADDTSDFYICNSGARLRGLVYIEREAARLIAEADNSGTGFDSDVRRWKSKMRCNVMYARWMSAIKVDN